MKTWHELFTFNDYSADFDDSLTNNSNGIFSHRKVIVFVEFIDYFIAR